MEGSPLETSPLSSTPLPEGFSDQIRDLYEHLYDASYLQKHALIQAWTQAQESGGEPGQMPVRRVLIEAIESTNPGSQFYFRAAQARPFQMLLLHYVERLTIQKAARELGVSERQAYRDLRQGEDNVAYYLYHQGEGLFSNKPSGGFPAPLPAGPAAETVSPAVDLTSLVRGAAQAVERLSAQQNVNLALILPDAPLIIPSDALIARQVLVSLLSRAVQQALASVQVELKQPSGIFELEISYTLRSSGSAGPTAEEMLQTFIRQLGWSIQEDTGPDAIHRAHLKILLPGLNVLMIDDDEGFIALTRRYLTTAPVHIYPVHTGSEGIAAARQGQFGCILLDVMMPGLDGWEVLQTLRTDPRTMNIPVIVCSVFFDPELARSLGASLMLHKPTSQDDLMSGLRSLGLI